MSDEITAALQAAAARGQQRRRTPDRRAAVRVGALERELDAFNDEMGWKVGQSIEKYHESLVAPALYRLAALESFTVPPAPLVARFGALLCRLGLHVHPSRVGQGPVPGTALTYVLAKCSRCTKSWVSVDGNSEYVRLG